MRTPAVVAVGEPPRRFETLFAAARTRAARIGWLDFDAPTPLDGPLEEAAALGALRAVSVGGGRALSIKPLRGEPVLRDLLREHFLGCALVLVRGLAGYPRLVPTASGYRLELSDARARDLDAESALCELQRPRHRS